MEIFTFRQIARDVDEDSAVVRGAAAGLGVQFLRIGTSYGVTREDRDRIVAALERSVAANGPKMIKGRRKAEPVPA